MSGLRRCRSLLLYIWLFFLGAWSRRLVASHDDEICDSAFNETGLPTWAWHALRRGQLNSAMVLAAIFAPSRALGNTAVGEKVPVRLPFASNVKVSANLTLLATVYRKKTTEKTVAAIWLGDPEIDGKTVYVALQSMIPENTLKLGPMTLTHTRLKEASWGGKHLKLSNFAKKYVEEMWVEKGLDKMLLGKEGILARYPDYKIIFTGTSFGAMLAQAVGLRCAIEMATGKKTWPNPVYIVDWNSFRWTNDAGSKLMSKYFGEKAVHFTMRAGDKTDPAGSFPSTDVGFVTMPNVFSISVAEGLVRPCNAATKCPREMYHKHLISAATHIPDFLQLHYAKKAIIPAMKAVHKVGGECFIAAQEDCEDLCQGIPECRPELHPESQHCSAHWKVMT